MTDKYPTPPANEEWEILDKYEDDDDGYHKYCVLVNSTNTDTGEESLKRVSSLYKQTTKITQIPHGLRSHISMMPKEDILALIKNYNEQGFLAIYNDIILVDDDKERRQQLKIFHQHLKQMIDEYIEPLKQQQIEKRLKWSKFGKLPTDMKTTTSVSEHPIFFELTHPDLIKKYSKYHEMCQQSESNKESETSENKTITCRICKGGHWTHSCPNKDSIRKPIKDNRDNQDNKDKNTDNNKESVDMSQAQKPLGSRSQSKTRNYVPPHKRNQQTDDKNDHRGRGGGRGGRGGGRGGRGGRGDRGSYGNRDNRDRPVVKTLKITNIAGYTEEHVVRDICQQYGNIYKFKYNQYKRRDYNTGEVTIESVTIYLTYTKQENAELALEGLNGFHHDSCLWTTAWADY